MSKQILIVDDAAESRYMLRSLLEGHGYLVQEAENGAVALELARAAPPDAVLTDLMMPRMDGFALCREWMQDDRLWRAPFIVYTATYTSNKDRQLVLDLGADAFIIKPAEPAALLGAIEEALAAARPKTDGRPELHSSEFFRRHADRLQEKLDRKLGQLADTERAMADYVARCEAILDASPIAIVSLDSGLVVRAWNYAAECLFGYAETEVLGQPLELLLPKDELERTEQKLAEAATDTDAVRAQGRWLHKDGHALELAVTLSFLGDEVGYIGAFSNLAELREADRERALLEEQLAMAQRMESVGRLAGGVAHDFNNLLTIIYSYAAFIENDSGVGDRLQEYARRIREAGDRASSLTRQLLAFSRRQTLRPEVLDLNQVVGEMEKMLQRLIGEDIELSVVQAPDLAPVEADVSQLEQVIMNLAINARDAMRDGGRLSIETRNATIDRAEAEAHPPMRPGRYVMMAVTDTGTGMDDETRARAFDPFFTTKEWDKGTGLGLATVYGIVKQSKGFIWIDSAIGSGTSFRIYLPTAQRPVTARSWGSTAEEPRGGNETLMVVEDDEVVRGLAARILAEAGYRVVEAPSGDEALRRAREGEDAIDLLLTDVIMPQMNGRDLARQMRALQPAIKVVFLSGYPDEAIAHHGVLRPGVSLVEKPFSARSLMSVVRAVLDGRAPGGTGDDLHEEGA